jgi:hypothetical protein
MDKYRKLNLEMIREIQIRYNEDPSVTQAQLAVEYGLGISTISYVVNQKLPQYQTDIALPSKSWKWSQASRTRQSEQMKGRTLSDVTRKKMGEVRKGNPNRPKGSTHSEESKHKIRESHLGMTHTEATKNKMRESQQRRRQREKEERVNYEEGQS